MRSLPAAASRQPGALPASIPESGRGRTSATSEASGSSGVVVGYYKPGLAGDEGAVGVLAEDGAGQRGQHLGQLGVLLRRPLGEQLTQALPASGEAPVRGSVTGGSQLDAAAGANHHALGNE